MPLPAYDCVLTASITSDPVTVSASGGSGSGPSYAWTYVSGHSAIQCDSPTAATTTFTGNVFRGQTKTAVWKCTVTRGVESVEVLVTINLIYEWNFA